MISAARAARRAREFLRSARAEEGAHRLQSWPPVAGGHRGGSAVTSAVVKLRIAQRLTGGFLGPVEDALFLTVGLRQLGYPASFHLGREIAPAKAPAGFYAWVQCGDDVVSTALPVREEYVEVHRVEPR